MLKIYTGNRLEKLLEILDENIKTTASDPLSKAPVCIQTPGMQRWIGLKLADMSGISANLDFIFPGALMKRLAGVKAGSRADWTEKQELIWSVFGKLKNLPDKPLYQQIISYLTNDHSNIKAYRLAGRIADTFDQYQIYRPDMVLDWLSPSPKQIPSEDKHLWQYDMFRSLFPHRNRCKTAVFHNFIKECEKRRPESIAESTPLHIFGISVLPIFFIDMLKAVSLHRDVYFYLLSPTRQYWGDSYTVREIRRREKKSGKTAEELYIEEKHELLDNLGVTGRDFFDHILGSDDSFIAEEHYEDINPDSILKTVQAEILDLEPVDGKRTSDGTISVNSCHNPLREMETLYDQLLEMFQTAPDLKPSEILVMTPDIEKYSPYIKAVFDNPYSEQSRIPYSIADISQRQTNRPAGVLLELIKLLTGDFSLSDVFRILSYDIVAENFGINPSELPALASAMESSGAFWAHNSEHLESEGLDVTDIFTWEKALRRTALGLAEGGTGHIYNDAAAKGIAFSLSSAIGGIMRFADKSAYYSKELKSEKMVSRWCSLIQEIIDDYFIQSKDTADDLLALSISAADIAEEAESLRSSLPAEPVLERLREILGEAKGAKGFMTGRVTFCAMLPMRSIPFRVIAVCGLDDNTFPRQKVSLEFDLMAKHPRPGDRNNRDSDRYLFLETLISAKEKLILSYKGQSERDNSPLSPSTLITELLTHLQNRFDTDDITTRHKLHSFSRDYFKDNVLFTYSPGRYSASAAFASEKKAHSFAEQPVETEEITEISLADFENFFISPPAYFLNKTLGINSRVYDETLPETEHLMLNPLQRYQLENSSITGYMTGKDSSCELEYLFRTAQIPPENLGRYHIKDTSDKSREISDKALKLFSGHPEKYTVDIYQDNLRIHGDLHFVSDSIHAYIKPSGIKPKDLLRSWIRHLVLNTQMQISTFIIGGGKEYTIKPYEGKHLTTLINIFRDGIRKPLRFHVTDGIRHYQDSKVKGLEKDDFSSAEKDPAFQICFATDTALDMNTADKILRPMFEHMEAGR